MIRVDGHGRGKKKKAEEEEEESLFKANARRERRAADRKSVV